jgi:hypothetical protein
MLFFTCIFLQSIGYAKHMRQRRINKNKLHAVLCIVASAALSIVMLLQLFNWLF